MGARQVILFGPVPIFVFRGFWLTRCTFFFPFGLFLLVLTKYPLGACWGGWDCNNPSYHAPAAYKWMRDFMASYSTEGASYSSKWDVVISTSYAVLLSGQCANTGMIPIPTPSFFPSWTASFPFPTSIPLGLESLCGSPRERTCFPFASGLSPLPLEL